MIVGLIADTHGLLLPEALGALQGAGLILHAGDVGPPAILRELERLAPVFAVSGNTDGETLRLEVPAERLVPVEDITIGVVHGDAWPPRSRMREMARHFAGSGARVVVYGHTHEARVETVDGLLLVNPGSAGKRTFGRRLSVGRLTVTGSRVQADIIPIEP